MDATQRKRVDELLAPDPHQQQDHGVLVLEAERSNVEVIAPEDKSGDLAFPVHVIPPERVKRLDDSVERALTMEITDAKTYELASEGLKWLEREIKAQDERVTLLRRPYGERQAKISEISKEGLVLAYRGVAEYKTKIKGFLDAQEAERQRQIEAQRKAQVEAEAKQRAIDEARRREEERLRLEAQAAEEAAQHAAGVIQQREQKAIAEMEAAGATAKAKEKLAKELAAQAEARALAEAAQVEADRKRRELEAQQEAEVIRVEPTVVHVSAPINVKGAAKVKMVPVIDGTPDLEALPLSYHMANEKMILKHLADGVKIDGVKFHMEPEIKSSRGALR